MTLQLQPVRVATGSEDGDGQLVFAGGFLVAVLVRLSDQHGADVGLWFLEAGFGVTSVARAPLFLDLDAAQDWIERHLGTKRVSVQLELWGWRAVRAILAMTGTKLPPRSSGFGDEPDMPERDAALYAAPGTLAWLEYVDLWRIGCGRSNYTTDGRLALDIHAAAAARPPTAAPAEPQAPSLVGMLDLTSATIDELRDIQNIAKHVGAAAYAYTWGPRCGTRGGRYGAVEPNGIGKLMHWLGDALTDVETAVDKEVVRRMPDSHADCETRLSMRAVAIIDNGDPDQTAAFARELLAHAEAERAGR